MNVEGWIMSHWEGDAERERVGNEESWEEGGSNRVPEGGKDRRGVDLGVWRKNPAGDYLLSLWRGS